jgi:ferrous iron transport protein B
MSAAVPNIQHSEPQDPPITYEGSSKILLAGNPNCGKTTLFNVLTGSRYKVANYPGVTVEKRVGKLLNTSSSIEVVDLPGIYSLTGQSQDEIVAENELRQSTPEGDLLVVVVDASHLERSLFLVSELLDLKMRVVVALNMTDLAKKDGIIIREVLLERYLGVPVIPLCASKKEGITTLQAALLDNLNKSANTSRAFCWAEGDEELIQKAQGTNHDADAASALATSRYRWIHDTIKKVVQRTDSHSLKRSDKLDGVIMHPVGGLFIFAAVMATMFQALFIWSAWPMDIIDGLVVQLAELAQHSLPDGILRSLIVDGVIAGVGSVVIFVPQIAILFFLIGLLEDSGYLSRAAFLMDRLMRHVGLQGRSFIPLLSSFACAVPGILAARTIPSRADRLITILVAPLMSCSARLPIYTVLIGAFIPATSLYGGFSLQGLTLLSLYLLGIFGAAAIAFVFKATLLHGEPTLFVMEMPRMKRPSLRLIFREVLDRVLIFIKTAGTVILACSIVLWFLASHPRHGTSNESVPIAESYAGSIGKAIEPVIRPLGYDWEIGVSLIASFAAREVFVSSLATIYNLSEDSSTQSLTTHLQDRRKNGNGFGLATALSLLVFYVFACQCMSTLAVCRRETGTWFWPALMFVYMTALAYGGAWVTYQGATFILG